MTDRPIPPEVPQYLLDGLNRQDPGTLRAIATYSEKLAAWQEAEKSRPEEKRIATTADAEESPEGRPAGVPAKAGVVVKEIRDNHYYYWQWRDGEKIRSKYKGPVPATK